MDLLDLSMATEGGDAQTDMGDEVRWKGPGGLRVSQCQFNGAPKRHTLGN